MSLYDELVPTFYVLRSLGRRASAAESEVYPLKKKSRASTRFEISLPTYEDDSKQTSVWTSFVRIQGSLKKSVGLISTISLCERSDSFDMEVKMTPVYKKDLWVVGFSHLNLKLLSHNVPARATTKIFAINNPE